MDTGAMPGANPRRRTALRFVLLIGLLSFFADFTYEGSRSIVGPFLGSLGASGFVVAIVAGLGELLGYGLRLVSGRWVDRTRLYWPTTMFGYVLQMASVPALALAGGWPAAALLVILERVGKAFRNPPRDAMLSHAAKDLGGYGWTFGLHEALDQFGALVGPLAVAALLAQHRNFRLAFAALLVPALLNLLVLVVARFSFPRPDGLDKTTEKSSGSSEGLPSTFWLYLSAAAFVAAGFADYPIIAFHFSRNRAVPADSVAFFYAIAMAASGAGSLIFGRLFDKFGFPVLIAITAVSAFFAPLVFLGGFWAALVGMVLWGFGRGRPGIHHSCRRGANAAKGPTCFRFRTFYRRVRTLLVCRKRDYRISLRSLPFGRNCVLYDRRAGSHSHPRGRKPAGRYAIQEVPAAKCHQIVTIPLLPARLDNLLPLLLRWPKSFC